MTLYRAYNQKLSTDIQVSLNELTSRAKELKTAIAEGQDAHHKFLNQPAKQHAILSDVVAAVNEANRAIADHEKTQQNLKAELNKIEKELAAIEQKYTSALDFDSKMDAQDLLLRKFNAVMKEAFDVLVKLHAATGSRSYLGLQLPVYSPKNPSAGYHPLTAENVCKDGVVDLSKFSGDAA
jgi:chromosome segregation ATPase